MVTDCKHCAPAEALFDQPVMPGYQVMIWDCPKCGLPIDVLVRSGMESGITPELSKKDGS